MASSLFPRNNLLDSIRQISSFMNGKNPQFVYNAMINSNPKFAEFVNNNKGKTLEQIAKENGIDYNSIKPYI